MVTGHRVTVAMTSKSTENKDYNKLSIQVSLDGFSFYVRNEINNHTSDFTYIPFLESQSPNAALDQIIEIFADNHVLQADFKSVEVVYKNELFTLVPSALFDKSKLTDYLKYNIKILQTDYVAYDEINEHNLVNVYIPYTNINNYFFDRFGSFTFLHNMSVFVKEVLDNAEVTSPTKIATHLGENSIDVVIHKGKQLLLANTYDYNTPEDVLYYLLFCMEQLDLNTNETELSLSGKIAKNDDIYNLAYKYIRKIGINENDELNGLQNLKIPII
ncbi:MAG: DUF3822 family protein [Leeuwenhoekiella sp.]